MSKRTASSAASDLIERLMPLRDNRGELHEALASFDTVLVGDAIAQLLAIAASVEGNLQKRRKLASISLCLPAEAFVDVVLFADRDTLDSMMLASRYMLDIIRKLQTHQLALRTLHDVRICIYWGDDAGYVQYILLISREHQDSEANNGVHLSFDSNLAGPCFPLLNGFVRYAYCKNVRIAFSGPARLTEEQLRGERDRLLANLGVHGTHVDVLSVECSTEEIADL
ncbi:hypothetical protein AAVH_34803, partial [Aphelenchoides avenae]